MDKFKIAQYPFITLLDWPPYLYTGFTGTFPTDPSFKFIQTIEQNPV